MQSNSEKFSDKAIAYGIPGVTVDGTDALAVHDAVAEGVARARAGNGPSIVEGVTMRMHGHAEHDPADYVPQGDVRGVGQEGPGRAVREACCWRPVSSTRTIAAQVRKDARQVAIDARKRALGDPMPDPSTVEEGVYAD